MIMWHESVLLPGLRSLSDEERKPKSKHATKEEASHSESSINNVKLVKDRTVDFVKERTDPRKEEDLQKANPTEKRR